jgi:F0F1-type ATP synthase assembly protein I
MPLDDKPPNSEPIGGQKIVRYTRQIALGTQIPFTLVGSVVFAGFLGHLLDQWLHTGPWLMTALGTVGFISGTFQVIRKLKAQGSGSTDGTRPS